MTADQNELISRALQAIELAKDEKGLTNLCTSTQAAIRELQAEQEWLDANESNPAQNRFVPSKQIKITKATHKITDNTIAITDKLTEMANKEREREENAAGPDTEYVQRATSLIGVIANSTADVTPSDLLAMAIPEHVSKFVQSRGGWYERGPNGSVQQVIEDELAEDVAKALQAQQFGRIVGTALDIARTSEVPLSVQPVLRTWSSHMRDYEKLYHYLPSDEQMHVCDDLFPVVIDGAAYTLARKTGKLTVDPPDGCHVLYPAIVANSSGESRALDQMVSHHFKTQVEIDAFYRICGISLFGYGIPNLVFLLGRGGSGKDALFSLMRTVHGGEKLVCSLDPLALMGHDESNNLVQLRSARLALCSFESSHRADGSFKPSVLKSITSGGANPITARAKYAKEAVDIYYPGSLWLYGNKVPNLTGGGDFDGLDRRFMILPMTKKLPEIPPPSGFTTWTEAITSCAPVFAWRCLDAFINWHKAGAPGYSDVRKRIPDEWRQLSNEHLMAGSRFGFLRDLFMPSETGLKQTTVFEVLGAIMKQEGLRMGRSKFHDVLKDTISDRARFDGKRHMEAEITDGIERLPITVVPSALHKLLDSMNINDALIALRSDGAWQPEVVETAHKFNAEAQLRARLYGGTE